MYIQTCHEEIRKLSHEAGSMVKEHGRDNDLVERIRNNSYFKPIHSKLDDLMNPKTFIGRAPEQVNYKKMLQKKICYTRFMFPKHL